jgi:hypothetical protein
MKQLRRSKPKSQRLPMDMHPNRQQRMVAAILMQHQRPMDILQQQPMASHQQVTGNQLLLDTVLPPPMATGTDNHQPILNTTILTPCLPKEPRQVDMRNLE